MLSAIVQLCTLHGALMLSDLLLHETENLGGNDLFPPSEYGEDIEICVRDAFGIQQVKKTNKQTKLFIIFKSSSSRLIFNW